MSFKIEKPNKTINPQSGTKILNTVENSNKIQLPMVTPPKQMFPDVTAQERIK